ncbi:MAG: methyltransferase domain-containing protein [Verrucomicrobia bacterium]|nr:methyltransferase domain-containing protein [Verrucomicrobiota bacterium]
MKTAVVAAGFSKAAHTYARHAGVQKAAADWLAEWLPIERTGRALEVGAGPGIFTRHLVPWKGRLVATDASAAMCVQGRLVWPQIEWRPMRAEVPELGSWDWIFTSSMLQWATEPAAVFEAWRTALAPGGRILGGLFVEESLPELRALMGGWSPVAWRTSEMWRSSLEGAGLRVLRSETRRGEFAHASALELLRGLHGVGATPVRRLSSGALRRLLRDYEALHGGPDGVRATWTFYRFEAERPA